MKKNWAELMLVSGRKSVTLLRDISNDSVKIISLDKRLHEAPIKILNIFGLKITWLKLDL